MKYIPGYENRYKISPCGKVYSCYTSRYRKTVIDRCGYRRIILCVGTVRRTKFIHRLVAETYMPPAPSPDHEINHIDCDKLNNHVDNLEWVTRGDNQRHAFKNNLKDYRGQNNPCAKLTDIEVDIIRNLDYTKYTRTQVAELFGVSQPTVSMILSGQRHSSRRRR